MPDRKRFLFDSDVLIAAKNFHYQPGFCPEFWQWIVDGHLAGLFFSIDKVKQELLNGGPKDILHGWASNAALASFFVDSAPSIAKWTALSLWANDPQRQYIEAAKTKFLAIESADAWLISVASTSGYEIITNETSSPESKRNIKLPDAATAMGVKCTPLHEVLNTYAGPGIKFKR